MVNKPAKAVDTSVDESAQGVLIYAKPDVKPQEVSVPFDDDRVEYVEVNKTEGTKVDEHLALNVCVAMCCIEPLM